MFDREIVMDSLRKIRMAIETILERAAVVSDPNELLTSPGGMMRLDAICMNLIALGEAVKGLDKQTHGELLPRYPEIYWSGLLISAPLLTATAHQVRFTTCRDCA